MIISSTLFCVDTAGHSSQTLRRGISVGLGERLALSCNSRDLFINISVFGARLNTNIAPEIRPSSAKKERIVYQAPFSGIFATQNDWYPPTNTMGSNQYWGIFHLTQADLVEDLHRLETKFFQKKGCGGGLIFPLRLNLKYMK